MSIYRVRYGLIFDDDFLTIETDRWRTISPSDAVVNLTGDEGESGDVGQMEIHHTRAGRSTNVMMDIPQDEGELLFQVYANYYPMLEGEGGGIVLWKNAMEKVEFIETRDSERDTTYLVWRAVKRGNLWAFYAQQENGSWELFDSTICVDPVMMGFVLRDHVSEEAETLKINKAVLCKGTHIQVANVSNGDRVVLKDVNGNVLRQADVPLNHSGVAIELPSIPFNGTIEVHQELSVGWQVVSVTEEIVEMYGGDLFLKGTDLKIQWRNKWLSETLPTQVGALKNGILELPMALHNTNYYDIAENTLIRVAQYMDNFGWKWVDVANDINGMPGEYSDEIEMGTLYPLADKTFWVKIQVGDKNDKDYLAQIMRPTNFYLEVVNS